MLLLFDEPLRSATCSLSFRRVCSLYALGGGGAQGEALGSRGVGLTMGPPYYSRIAPALLGIHSMCWGLRPPAPFFPSEITR